MSQEEYLASKLLKLICWTLTAIFVALKIFGVSNMSWAMVFSPIIIPTVMGLILFLVAEVIDAIAAMKDR
jgi:ABC-type uncharacterized transport system permease subunit